MKNYLAAALIVTATSFAVAPPKLAIEDIEAVNVLSVEKKQVGNPATTRVTAVAEFTNSCRAPQDNELKKIITYSSDFASLNIALGIQSDRVCSSQVKPVQVTIYLGGYTRPNDGEFENVTINGVEAP